MVLASDRVIDACILQLPGGGWRLWYNNERDHKSIYFADSPDLTYLFYFTHPGRRGPDEKKDGYVQRRSSKQVVELNKRATC
jgi:hypothetical protein